VLRLIVRTEVLAPWGVSIERLKFDPACTEGFGDIRIRPERVFPGVVGLMVGVSVAVAVAVRLGVAVLVGVAVCVLVGVRLGVAVRVLIAVAVAVGCCGGCVGVVSGA
jgi:hypothetical protein